MEQFAKLFEAKPTDSLHFKMAYCMLKCNRVEEAMAILYELNYKNPKDTLVLRALGWGNMLRRKYDEAKNHYEQLKSLCEEDTSLYSVEDTYNYGFGCRRKYKTLVLFLLRMYPLPRLMKTILSTS